MEKYCGDGEPPSWKLTIQAKSNEATLADFDGAVTLEGAVTPEGSAWKQESLIVPINMITEKSSV